MDAKIPEDHPPGTIRYRREGDAEYTVCSPRNIMYSTITMLAQEYWNGETKSWLPILDDEDG